ncbi:KR domain-containing protein [Sesbania bispinosa]|nr:KR domain-containing protein [Sesbania bispinosa]
MGAARERRRQPCMAAAAAASAHGDGATAAQRCGTEEPRRPRPQGVTMVDEPRQRALDKAAARGGGKMEVAVVEWDRGCDGGKEQRRSVPVLRKLWL